MKAHLIDAKGSVKTIEVDAMKVPQIITEGRDAGAISFMIAGNGPSWSDQTYDLVYVHSGLSADDRLRLLHNYYVQHIPKPLETINLKDFRMESAD